MRNTLISYYINKENKGFSELFNTVCRLLPQAFIYCCRSIFLTFCLFFRISRHYSPVFNYVTVFNKKAVRVFLSPLVCYQSFVTPIVTFSPLISHSLEFSALSPYFISCARTSWLICSEFFLTSCASLSFPLIDTVM